MRYIILTILVASSIRSFAQHEENNFNRSVFQGVEVSVPMNTKYKESIRNYTNRHFPGWSASTDKISGRFSDLYGPALAVSGSSFSEKAAYLIANQLKDLGIEQGQWREIRNESTPKAHYVDLEQSINNKKVAFSRLSFRFTRDGRLVRIKNSSFGTAGTQRNATITRKEVMDGTAMLTNMHSVAIVTTEVSEDWVWFPVPVDGGYELRPAWEVTLIGWHCESIPLHLNGFIDGITGEVLYRTNEIKEIDIKATGNVFKHNTASPVTLESLQYMEIVLDRTAYLTDAAGSLSTAAVGDSAIFNLQGSWSRVIDAPSGRTPSDTLRGLSASSINNHTFSGAPPKDNRHVNAFYHVNTVHDFIKGHLPSFTGLDFPLTTNIDVSGGQCNAYYSGFGSNNSINFYAEAGGCGSFALTGDIVYHEYGHAINRTFYSASGAGSMRNGALNEAHADVWAMSITGDSMVARNYSGVGSSIRRYDGANSRVYPKDIVGIVHTDGEIIAGAWFDVAKNIGSYDTMTQIFSAVYYDVPDGPNGMEGKIYHEILISALLNDDDDNNLSNGSPHFDAIVKAFAKHGIFLHGDATLSHQELAHQPANSPIPVNANLSLQNEQFFQSLKLVHRTRTISGWDTVVMTNNGNGNFSGTIPAQTQGTIIDYYFMIYDYLNANTVTFPIGYTPDAARASQVTIPFQFGVGVSPMQQVSFEDPLVGWTLADAGDNATAGTWVQTVPTASYYRPEGGAFGRFIAQPGADKTSGTGKCLVTGNAASSSASASSADVDEGRTTVITPAFDLSGYVNPMIEYYRWFVNDYGSNRRNDPWRVEMKADGSSFVRVDYTFQSDTSWRRRIFTVDQFLPGKRKDVQLRFIASDNIVTSADEDGQTTVVEAAIDDFAIYDGVPTGIADLKRLQADIYPNPANGYVSIQLGDGVDGKLSVCDIRGVQLVAEKLSATQTSYQIDTRALVPGNYMILLQSGKTLRSYKLSVQH